MAGTLFLIPTPLGDAPASAALPVEVAATAARLDYFIAENARSARAFLKNVANDHPLARAIQDIEIRELNISTPPSQLPDLLRPIREGRDAGLVSEAGCPAIADPGAALVRLAHRENLAVRPLIGPSSILLALMASGLNGQSFAFQGYLPTDSQARERRIRELERAARDPGQTQIFIETPYRNQAVFDALIKHCAASTDLAIASELTLPGEWIRVHSVGEWRKRPAVLSRSPMIFLFLPRAGR